MSLSIYYQNVRGLRSKTHDIRLNTSLCDFDIICFTETFLNSSINDYEIFSKNYTVLRRDRDSSTSDKLDGGGVLCGVKNGIDFIHKHEWSSNAEDIWVTLYPCRSSNSSRLHLCCVYIPPTCSDSLNKFLTKLISIISEVPNEKILICGDFNLPLLLWQYTEHNTYLFAHNTYNLISMEFVDTMEYCNLKQYNGERNSNDRILDLTLANFETVDVRRCDPPLSKIDLHHPPLLLHIDFEMNDTLKPNFRNIYNFKKANYTLINENLSLIPWHSILKDLNIEDATDRFYVIINDTLRNYVPQKSIGEKCYPQWYSLELISLIKQKYRAHKKFKETRNHFHYNNFSLLRKRVKQSINLCYAKYINDTEKQIPLNIKKFWSYVSSVKKENMPSALSYGVNYSSNGKDICNLFAEYFNSVYSNTQDCIVKDSLQTHDFTNNNLGNIYFDENEVFENLSKLDEHKGAGCDGIPSLFARRCAASLSLPLALLFNKSLSESTCPLIWKKALVVPLFKNGIKSKVENYRPISKLCVFEKIFEKIIFKYLFSAVKNYLRVEQHGFFPGRSVETNIVSYVDEIFNLMDERYQVDAVYTDYTKAFDKINHNILLIKLANFGICGNLLEWFRSYLSNRSQCVVLNGFCSKSFSILSGVPQGSHLGPLLFNIFINDVSLCFKFAKFSMYADDLKIYAAIKGRGDCKSLQDDLNRFYSYCSSNDLTLNYKKCSIITFTRNRDPFIFNYCIANDQIPRVSNVRDLGIILDNKLLFDVHIDYITKKANRMLGFMLRIGHRFKNPTTYFNLYFSLVRSVLEFGTVCWTPQYDVYINRIEGVQRRFLTNVNRKFPNNSFNLPSLVKRRKYYDMIFLFKAINHIFDAPVILNRLCFKVPLRDTRSTDLFYSPQCNTNASKNSPFNRISYIINSLSKNENFPDIFLCDLNYFKNEIKNYV